MERVNASGLYLLKKKNKKTMGDILKNTQELIDEGRFTEIRRGKYPKLETNWFDALDDDRTNGTTCDGSGKGEADINRITIQKPEIN
jgi:hypothetical protein